MISATGRPGDNVTVRPTSTIAVVGEKVTFSCTTRVNNEAGWDFYAYDSMKPISIYNKNNIQANLALRVTMNFDGCRYKTCNLTIESVQATDAGYYVCYGSSSSVSKAASLVVLGITLVFITLVAFGSLPGVE